MKDKLERELAFMKEKQAAFVFTAYEFGDENAVRTGKVVHVPPVLTYFKALSRTVIFTTTVLLDTDKTGRELIQMPNVKSEDTATWWKLLRNGFTAYGLDEVLAVYRFPPIRRRRSDGSGICTAEKKNCLFCIAAIIFFSGRCVLP